MCFWSGLSLIHLSMANKWGAGKGQALMKREGQREGKELRQCRAQSADKTGGTRSQITFSQLLYLLFDRDSYKSADKLPQKC